MSRALTLVLFALSLITAPLAARAQDLGPAEAASQLGAPDDRAELLAEIQARRAGEREARSRAAVGNQPQELEAGRWSYSLGPHLGGSIPLMAVGAACILTGALMTMPGFGVSYYAPAGSVDSDVTMGLLLGGAAALAGGLVWMVAAVAGRRRIPQNQFQVTAGATSSSGWIGLSGRF